MTTESIVPKGKIILCLSGGGFRATYFHLGVVRALKEFWRLQDVSDIVSVSGGSILAAHMAVNWKRYIADVDDFESCRAELHEFASHDLRGRVLRRFFLLWPLGAFIDVLRWPLR